MVPRVDWAGAAAWSVAFRGHSESSVASCSKRGHAEMANPEHLEILKQGVEQWNRWREDNPDVAPDLRYADLRAANLCGAHLRKADLSSADLRMADFHGANLSGAALRGANLSGVSLGRANLHYTNICSANLAQTDFSGAGVGSTIFDDVYMSNAKGVEAANHSWPSTIGVDTVCKSNGKVPEVFLRGCGVPDELIAYIGAMVGRPIEFYSCFISYSTHNQEFAERLHADLQAKGVRCWFAPHDVRGGRKIHEQIDEAIRLHDRLLLILSEHSMSSEWVKTEIAKARKREGKVSWRLRQPTRRLSTAAALRLRAKRTVAPSSATLFVRHSANSLRTRPRTTARVNPIEKSTTCPFPRTAREQVDEQPNQSRRTTWELLGKWANSVLLIRSEFS